MAQVFISHIEQEKDLAAAVEDLIKSSVGASVFRSSNTLSLVAGETFESRIRAEISGCVVLVMLCSAKSFASHWVHVEAGAAWALGKTVIPACYAGKTRGQLPRPYSSLQAINLDDAYQLALGVSRGLSKPFDPIPGPSRGFLFTRVSGKASPELRVYEHLYTALNHVDEISRADDVAP